LLLLFLEAPFEEAEAPFLDALLLLLFEEALEAPPFLAALLLLAPLEEALLFLEAPFEELFEAPFAELLPAAFFAVAMLI
jgi:hypothetical protein